MHHGPLVKGVPILKGFLSGSLLGVAFTIPYGLGVQIILFLAALFVFVDSVCCFGGQTHLLSFLFFWVIGLAFGIILGLIGFSWPYTVLILVIGGGLYLHTYMGRKIN